MTVKPLIEEREYNLNKVEDQNVFSALVWHYASDPGRNIFRRLGLLADRVISESGEHFSFSEPVSLINLDKKGKVEVLGYHNREKFDPRDFLLDPNFFHIKYNNWIDMIQYNMPPQVIRQGHGDCVLTPLELENAAEHIAGWARKIEAESWFLAAGGISRNTFKHYIRDSKADDRAIAGDNWVQHCLSYSGNIGRTNAFADWQDIYEIEQNIPASVDNYFHLAKYRGTYLEKHNFSYEKLIRLTEMGNTPTRSRMKPVRLNTSDPTLKDLGEVFVLFVSPQLGKKIMHDRYWDAYFREKHSVTNNGEVLGVIDNILVVQHSLVPRLEFHRRNGTGSSKWSRCILLGQQASLLGYIMEPVKVPSSYANDDTGTMVEVPWVFKGNDSGGKITIEGGYRGGWQILTSDMDFGKFGWSFSDHESSSSAVQHKDNAVFTIDVLETDISYK